MEGTYLENQLDLSLFSFPLHHIPSSCFLGVSAGGVGERELTVCPSLEKKEEDFSGRKFQS